MLTVADLSVSKQGWQGCECELAVSLVLRVRSCRQGRKAKHLTKRKPKHGQMHMMFGTKKKSMWCTLHLLLSW